MSGSGLTSLEKINKIKSSIVIDKILVVKKLSSNNLLIIINNIKTKK